MSDLVEHQQKNSKGLLQEIQGIFSNSAKPGKQIIYHSGRKISMKIPNNIRTIYLSGSAAGGAGCRGWIDGGIIHAGNSGGSAGAISTLPVPVEPGMNIEIYVGGGHADRDGESTIVELHYRTEKRRIVIEGGKRATPVKPGEKGHSPLSRSLDGQDGEFGESCESSCQDKPKPADGPASFYGSKCSYETRHGNGFGWGAAGISLSPNEHLIKPGSGVIIVEW